MRFGTYFLAVAAVSGAIATLAAPGVARADSASSVAGPMQPLTTGAAIYQHVCQGCHMADGRGAAGASSGFPGFAGNTKLQTADFPIYTVLNGHGGMPSFAGLLTDKQVADVVNFIRTHFGNHFSGAATPTDVAPMRPELTKEDE
ncbi:c-type cytochrome [Acetobacter oeni]|uniref:Cytochrome c6 n=1 Tax=Acetobacter oeni TaxID=304077 RepID=A0A511XNU4_9PROT|nr:cytochrome c [Acetobacter oeni]MBB3881640.1 mono/diheme cytochrome c family protein [Acetobacter oeni]NHO17550.1 c-type cytochrome [Acetobacter oeni]GBR00990.1 cytochrome c precursor [Acetobacter oeni LMG 21952]GEN64605.1 cytochrome c6 [Acetobacter oeni]